jgi:hypothetical protein
MAKRHNSSKKSAKCHSKRKSHKKSKSRSHKKTRSRRTHHKMMNKNQQMMNKNQHGGVYYGFNLEDRISNQPAVFAGSNCPASRPDSKDYIYEMYGMQPPK